jgi:hypothetical protein
MGETCWGLKTRYEYHFLIFLTPTQTHVSDAHSHGYSHFSTVICGVSGLLKKETLAQLRTVVRLRLFKLVIKLG